MGKRHLRRMEAKKRKVEAFLEVARMNDEDRANAVGDCPSAKRSKTEVGGADESPRLTTKPLLSGESYEVLRARLRERKKLLSQLPDFGLKAVGENASAEIPVTMRTPLLMSDLQTLLMYLMVGDRMPWATTRWCKVLKWNKFSNVVCLVIEGGNSAMDLLTARDTDESANKLSCLFKHKLAMVAPASYGSTVAQDLSTVAASKTRQKLWERAYGSLDKALQKGAGIAFFRSVFPVKESATADQFFVLTGWDSEESPLKLRLLLSAWQMVDEDYPLRLPGMMDHKYLDYAFTSDFYNEVTADSPMFAVDCEMVMTKDGMELASICVVDEDLKVVYRSLVKPHNEIINYLTRFSGITKETLEGVETRLLNVQKDLKQLLPSDAILVGQSLNSDLAAMRMLHPYVIDTSVIYNLSGDRKKKTKLSVLSEMFLGEKIQRESRRGHSPEEDAIAAMKLVLLKLEKGYEYGDAILGGEIPHFPNYQKELRVSLVDEMKTKGTKSLKIICQEGSVAEQYASTPGYTAEEDMIRVPGDFKAVVDRGCQSALEHDLTLCHLALPGESFSWAAALEAADTMWRHVSENGLFLTLLTSGRREDRDAMLGVAFRKAEVPAVAAVRQT